MQMSACSDGGAGSMDAWRAGHGETRTCHVPICRGLRFERFDLLPLIFGSRSEGTYLPQAKPCPRAPPGMARTFQSGARMVPTFRSFL